MDNDPSKPEHEHGAARPKPAPDPAHGVEDVSAGALSEALRSSFNVVKLLMGALVLAFVLSGVFTVKPNQVAIKLRFGKPVGVGDGQLLKPGLHWKFPFRFAVWVNVRSDGPNTALSRPACNFKRRRELQAARSPRRWGSFG